MDNDPASDIRLQPQVARRWLQLQPFLATFPEIENYGGFVSFESQDLRRQHGSLRKRVLSEHDFA